MSFSYVQVEWAQAQGFNGWMIWALDLDDFNGEFCGGSEYPLLKAMNYATFGEVPTEPTAWTEGP